MYTLSLFKLFVQALFKVLQISNIYFQIQVNINASQLNHTLNRENLLHTLLHAHTALLEKKLTYLLLFQRFSFQLLSLSSTTSSLLSLKFIRSWQVPWSRRLQRNERLTHTLSSASQEHTHTHNCEEEWQITAAATVHAWTCVSNVKSRLLLIHGSVFFPSLSLSLFCPGLKLFSRLLSLFFLLYFIS